MKKLSIFTCVILFILSTNLLAQWNILNPGFKGSVITMDFLDDNIGWIAGSEGLFMKTDDGGFTWNSIPINEEWTFNEIDFANERIGWAIGESTIIDGGLILKTEDGGHSWNILEQQASPWKNDLQVINDSIVYIATGEKIIRTTNGGANWSDITPKTINAEFNSIKFLDSEHGLAGGATIWEIGFISRTSNGGLTWETTLFSQYKFISDLQFGTDSLGYFKATNYDNFGNFLCQTNDFGQSCEEVYKSTYSIHTYHISNNDIIYINEFDSLYSTHLLKSSNHGKSWENIFPLGYWHVVSFKFNREEEGIVICDNRSQGAFMVLSNKFDKINWLSKTYKYPFHDVFFLDQKRGFTVGGYHRFHDYSVGDMLYTDDGGITWLPSKSVLGVIGVCEFFDDSIGYLLNTKPPSAVYKTIDSGIHWEITFEDNHQFPGWDVFCNDIFLTSSEEIWIAGRYWEATSEGASIVNSTDGGLSWNLVFKYPSPDDEWFNIYSIQFADDIGWAVGDNGLIISIVNSDSFRVVESETDLPLNEVFFSDSKYGWIAGGYDSGEDDYHPLLLKSDDGGLSWIEQKNFPYLVKELFFQDSLQGWAVGADINREGIIVATNNGGESWYVQEDKLPGVLNAIHFVDDYGWVVGEQGQVFRTENGGVSWTEESKKNVYITTFWLEQNYPNPFNPTTAIGYQLSAISDVELSIYNLLGQKVVTLVSERQKAGQHQVAWDASGFASGIYYYKITAGEFQDVKKMILLR